MAGAGMATVNLEWEELRTTALLGSIPHQFRLLFLAAGMRNSLQHQAIKVLQSQQITQFGAGELIRTTAFSGLVGMHRCTPPL